MTPTPNRAPVAGWTQSLLLGVLLALIYALNFRELGIGDTVPASQLPTAVLHGDGVFLDRFYPNPDALPNWVALKRGHVVSRYPLGTALFALPFEAPQILVLDVFRPGWDRDPDTAIRFCTAMSKITSVVIGVLTALVLFSLLRRLGLGWLAWPATLAAALGSDLWCVGSQGLWQHGPAALALTVTMFLLLPEKPSPGRLFFAGLTTACLVCFRALDVVFAAAIFLAVAWRWPRGLMYFLPFPLLLGGLLLASNWWFFGTVQGGQPELEAYNPGWHHVEGVWTGNLIDGAAGTLFSPSRGLFVFSPWALLAVLGLPAVWARLRQWPVLLLLTVGLAVNLVALSRYAVWWGGCSFGPRYWTDAMPIFAVLLGLGLSWAWQRCRPAFWGCAAAIVLSVTIQTIGAFCYPSSFNVSPNYVDVQHERLWDWGDGELARCLREGPHLPWQSAPPAPDAAVRQVLNAQVEAWNHGDLDAFMAGYWSAPDLTFYSGPDRTSGWQATLDRYRKRYQAEGKEMGQLTFSDVDVKMLGPDYALVRGRWQLELSTDKPGGLFTLIFRRLPEGWRIIHDHTSK